MKDQWTTDVSDIPEHILKDHIEVLSSNAKVKKYLVREVEFYRNNGYPIKTRPKQPWKKGTNPITGFKAEKIPHSKTKIDTRVKVIMHK